MGAALSQHVISDGQRAKVMMRTGQVVGHGVLEPHQLKAALG